MFMEKKEIPVFIQKMMDKIVQFYHVEVKKEFDGEGYDTNEEAFTRALNIVTSTAFVSADLENDKIILYALDPCAFIPFTVSGHCDLWSFLQNWVNNYYKITLAIAKFDMKKPLGIPIYHDTKDYLSESKRMVDDEAVTFEAEFLETE